MIITDLLALPYQEARTFALVFGQAAYDALRAAQAARPQAQHRAAPVGLADGRWILCADLLTETHPGGLFAEGFTALPHEMVAQVGVMPWSDALALLPKPEPERARDALGQFVGDDPSTPDINEAWVTP